MISIYIVMLDGLWKFPYGDFLKTWLDKLVGDSSPCCVIKGENTE